MKAITKSRKFNNLSLDGPGKLSKLMGIHHSIDDMQLKIPEESKDGIRIDDLDYSKLFQEYIETTPRIGIDYVEEDALLLYRFVIPFKNRTALGLLEKISEPINN